MVPVAHPAVAPVAHPAMVPVAHPAMAPVAHPAHWSQGSVGPKASSPWATNVSPPPGAGSGSAWMLAPPPRNGHTPRQGRTLSVRNPGNGCGPARTVGAWRNGPCPARTVGAWCNDPCPARTVRAWRNGLRVVPAVAFRHHPTRLCPGCGRSVRTGRYSAPAPGRHEVHVEHESFRSSPSFRRAPPSAVRIVLHGAARRHGVRVGP